jgi:acetylornithine deacetylase/succinyl-diaminopimelate desuccinylase-like protein
MIGDAIGADLERRCGRWETWLAELIRLPSTFGRERGAVDYVAARLASLGLPVHFVAHDRDRSSVVCRIAGAGTGRSLIVNAHLDVVAAGDESAWTHPPYGGWVDRERGLIFGRGAVDDKAGVVVLLALAELVAQRRLAGDLVLQFVLDDERGGEGSRRCLEAGWTGDAALIVDGTRGDRAICQHAGQLEFSIAVRGKPASIGVAHIGVNAAEMLARLVLELRDAVAACNAGRVAPWTRFPSPFQLVVQRLHARAEQMTVPDRAEATCYATFPPPQTLEGFRRRLEACAERFRLRAPEGLGIDFAWDGFCAEPVGSFDPELSSALQATAAELGMPAIDIGPSTGTSDMRHFVARGIPCMLYGPGTGFNPHRADESFALDDLPRIVAFYAAFARRWCGTA